MSNCNVALFSMASVVPRSADIELRLVSATRCFSLTFETRESQSVVATYIHHFLGMSPCELVLVKGATAEDAPVSDIMAAQHYTYQACTCNKLTLADDQCCMITHT